MSTESNYTWVWHKVFSYILYLQGFVWLLFAISFYIDPETSPVFPLIISFVNFFIGYKVLQKRFLWIVIATILSMNPIIWISNIFYYKNRSDELH